MYHLFFELFDLSVVLGGHSNERDHVYILILEKMEKELHEYFPEP